MERQVGLTLVVTCVSALSPGLTCGQLVIEGRTHDGFGIPDVGVTVMSKTGLRKVEQHEGGVRS